MCGIERRARARVRPRIGSTGASTNSTPRLITLTTYVIFVIMVQKTTSKAVYLRGLPAEVVRGAKAEAARRGVTLAGFVAETLTHALDQRQSQPRAQGEADLRREQRW